MRRPGRIDVLIAGGRIIGIAHVRQAIGSLHLICAGTLNAGGLAFVNGMLWFSFVRGLDWASGHAILR